MRILKTKWFARFARKENIKTGRLVDAVIRAERGKIDADLGGNLIKQRIARPGQGRSGGYRTVIAFQMRKRVFFSMALPKMRKAISMKKN